MAVGRERWDRAKKPSHMEAMPLQLRQTCRRQLDGRMVRRVERAQTYSNRTEGMPRDRTISGSVAPRPAATFTKAPIAANMAQASNIHKDCMRHHSTNRKPILYTLGIVIPFLRSSAPHETNHPVSRDQPGGPAGAQHHHEPP